MQNGKTKNSKSHGTQSDVTGYLLLSEEDFEKLTIDNYLRLERFKTGDAAHADRQTTVIRIYAGMHRLLDFHHDGGGSLLHRALLILSNYRPQAKKEVRKLNDEQVDLLKQALGLIDDLFSQSTLWEKVQAYKYGEDKCLIDSNKTEYVLMTVH